MYKPTRKALWQIGSLTNSKIYFISEFFFKTLLIFVYGFLSHLNIFHSCGDITTADEGLKFWPMLDTHGHWTVRVL